MENPKDKVRKIIHIDMDCFFAAIEERDYPELKGKPIAIGGGERGVLSTANYEARKYGLRSAMPTKTAIRLCPHVILRPSRFDKYKEASRTIRDIFFEYTDKVQPLSLDEAFLDLSNCDLHNGSATLIANEIRQKIYDKTQLTASAGIAPNKFLAKIASDWRKPNGSFTIAPHQIDEFMKELPVKKIYGVGKKSAEKLNQLGIFTCGDLQKWNKEKLFQHFNNWGLELYQLARGIDNRDVKSDWKRKSLSVENTFMKDIDSFIECQDKLNDIFEDLKTRYYKLKESRPIKTIFIKVKFYDFEQTTVDKKFDHFPTLNDFYPILEDALSRKAKAVRLIGMGIRFEDEDSFNNLQLKLL